MCPEIKWLRFPFPSVKQSTRLYSVACSESLSSVLAIACHTPLASSEMAFPDPAIIEGAGGGGSPVPLEPGLTRRFYYPLILLSSLVRVFKAKRALRMPDLETAPADLFKTFVNKLGHICDSAKGGEKVTAFAILQLGTIQYYFTSNQRDEEGYQFTAQYITDILNTLGGARDDEIYRPNGSDESLLVFGRLLRMIIGFNQSRIKGYVCRMGNELDFCTNFARGDLSDQGEPPLPSNAIAVCRSP